MKLETLGLRLLFAALVLSFFGEIAWFPVWTAGRGGSSMLILLGYVTEGPVAFVLARIVPAAAVIGLSGACLIEVSRWRAEPRGGRWLDRSRSALLTAVVAEATLLGSFALLPSVGTDLFSILAAVGMVATLALGLYLFWTAEVRTDRSAKPILLAALGVAFLSAGLGFALALATVQRLPPAWSVIGGLDAAQWGIGEVSLGLWILGYAAVIIRGRRIPSPVLAAL